MTTIHDAVSLFLGDFATGRQSQGSIQTYAQGLKRFSEYASHAGLTRAGDLNVSHALGFARWLSEEREPSSRNAGSHLAKATLNLYLSCVSKFYGYLLREKIITLDASELQRLKDAYHEYRKGSSRHLPKLPPEDAITALLSAAHQVELQPTERESEAQRRKLERLRNIAILSALRASGMRVGELVRMRRGDMDYRTHTARVTGKGGRSRIAYFDETAWEALQTYLRERHDGAGGRALGELPVFAQHGKRAGTRVVPITTHQVRVIFDKLVESAQIEVPITPHWLRHRFATRVLDATGDLAVVQDMLGHRSPETTRIYAQVSDRKKTAAYHKAFGA